MTTSVPITPNYNNLMQFCSTCEHSQEIYFLWFFGLIKYILINKYFNIFMRFYHFSGFQYIPDENVVGKSRF